MILREGARVAVLAQLRHAHEGGHHVAHTANVDETVLPSPSPVTRPRFVVTSPRFATGSPLATVN